MMHRPTRRRYDAHRTSRLSSGFRRAILNHRASDVGSVAITADLGPNPAAAIGRLLTITHCHCVLDPSR